MTGSLVCVESLEGLRRTLLLATTLLVSFMVVPLRASAICEVCTTDVDCLGSGGVCFAFDLDGQDSCTASCALPADCPTGFSCVDIGAPTPQCFPDTSSCACDGSDLSLTTECQLSDPFDPQRFCVGISTCTSTGWGACEPPPEICSNGVDDDCDGAVDEDGLPPNFPNDTCVPAPSVPALGNGELAGVVVLLVSLGFLVLKAGSRRAA